MDESMNARWLKWLLTGIVFFLAVIAVELGVLIGSGVERQAFAQIPDSGLQRKQMLGMQDRSNVLLDEILQFLRTQTLKVKVVGPDKEARPETAASPPVGPAPRVIRK